MHIYSNKKVLGLLVVMLVALALSSFSAMFANVFAHQAERIERQWLRGVIPTKASVDHAYDWIIKARLYAPGEPYYAQVHGALFIWAVDAGINVGVARQEEALSALRASWSSRPQWPYTMAQLALLKAQLGQFDDEYWQALQAAEQYGQWEPIVIKNLLLATLMYWPELSVEQRVFAFAVFERAIRYRKTEKGALAVAAKAGLLKGLCSVTDHGTLTKHIAKRCK